ncbi:MAG: hypothetical protein ACYTAN_17170 [Planctomycetota bacterium]|jgi:hypothetical protein
MRVIPVVILAAILALSLQASAHAYLDPGTGSYILMMLISGVVGGAYAVKLYWKRISAFFSGKSSEESDPPETDVDEQP